MTDLPQPDYARNMRIIGHSDQGGRADGFRAYSRKQAFPAESAGLWTVDVLTPQAQLLQRLRFVVEG